MFISAQNAILDNTLKMMSEEYSYHQPTIPQYPQNAINKITGMVYGHNYARSLLPLLYLMKAVYLLQPKKGFYYFGMSISPLNANNIMAYFYSLQHDKINVNKDSLTIDLDKPFIIQKHAMVILLVFFEFIMSLSLNLIDDDKNQDETTLNIQNIIILIESLADIVHHQAMIKKSEELRQILEKILTPITNSQQQANKFKDISKFIAYHNHDVNADTINDDMILKFWQLQNTPESQISRMEFKSFASVFDAFSYAKSLLYLAEENNIANQHINIDEEWAFYHDIANHHDGNDDTIENVHNVTSPLQYYHDIDDQNINYFALLKHDPYHHIKVMNKDDIDILTKFFKCEQSNYSLLLSWVRSRIFHENFGKSYLNAEKNSNAQHHQADIRIIETAAKQYYPAFIDYIQRLENDINIIINACLYVMMQSRDDKIIDFKQMANAKDAFTKINKQGFRKQDMDNPTMMEAHHALANILPNILEKLRHLSQALNQYDWQQQWQKDIEIFSQQFNIIYGDQHA